jgi:hypothetical protein
MKCPKASLQRLAFGSGKYTPGYCVNIWSQIAVFSSLFSRVSSEIYASSSKIPRIEGNSIKAFTDLSKKQYRVLRKNGNPY